MRLQHLIFRLAGGVVLLVLAAASMLFALLLFSDIGLPPPRVPGVMHIDTIEMAGIVLRGWQMYLAYLIPALLSVVLAAIALRMLIVTLKA